MTFPSNFKKLPSGHTDEVGTLARSLVKLGQLIRAQRNRLKLRQLDVAGLGNRGNRGNRFVIDVENGKPTVQLQGREQR